MLRRKPFFHLPAPHATAQEFPGGYASVPCLAFQRVVVRCRHLHREAVFQLVCRSLLGTASLVSSVKYPFLFRPTGCGFHRVSEREQAVSVCPKHKLASLKTPLDRFRVTPNCIPLIRFLIFRVYAIPRCPHRRWQDAAGRCSPPVPTRSSCVPRTCGRCGRGHRVYCG